MWGSLAARHRGQDDRVRRTAERGVRLEKEPLPPSREFRDHPVGRGFLLFDMGLVVGREGDQLVRPIHRTIEPDRRKRQVRRMFEALGHPVVHLVRRRVGHLELGELPIGDWRELVAEEIELLGGDGASIKE